VFNWCSFSKNAQEIVTLTGIILAFISILLSYKGLIVTNEVKKDIGIQQFKIKQHEEVAKVIYLVNTCFYNLRFIDEKGITTEANVNLVGINNLIKSKKIDFKQFDNCSVYYTGTFPFDKFNEEIFNVFMPSLISKALSSLLKGCIKIEKTDWPNNCVIVTNPFDKEDNLQLFQENNYCLGYNWASMQEKVQGVIDSINAWYKTENYTEEVNFVPISRWG
jgi:hypothetical protein